jgi:hypothetical protein
METEVFDDLRQFIEAAKKMSDWKEIRGADWDLQIGTLIEAAAELIPQPPMLIFDDISTLPAIAFPVCLTPIIDVALRWPSL